MEPSPAPIGFGRFFALLRRDFGLCEIHPSRDLSISQKTFQFTSLGSSSRILGPVAKKADGYRSLEASQAVRIFSSMENHEEFLASLVARTVAFRLNEGTSFSNPRRLSRIVFCLTGPERIHYGLYRRPRRNALTSKNGFEVNGRVLG
jgi:hypothetical protein